MQLKNVAKLISIIVVPTALILYFNDGFRKEYYWFIHILFGFGAPWVVSVLYGFLEKKEFSFSFKMGLVITAIGSVFNEYYMDASIIRIGCL